MALSVSQTVSNWQPLQTTASCPQFQMTIQFNWIDNTGAAQSFGPTTVTFPNIISQMTAAEKNALADAMQDVIVQIARRRAGVDN